MALRMPRPFLHKTGVFFLNVRVPGDLVAKVRWTRVALPVGEKLVTISITEKVFLSLQTKEPNLARTRFAAAYAALVRHWEAVRLGPRPLTHKQLVALAGEAYRYGVDSIENDPEHGPHVIAREALMEREAIAEWRYGDGDGLGEIDEEKAHFFAALQRPYGPQLIALETGHDLDTPYAKVTYAQALEDLFGTDADRVLAEHALIVGPEARAKLMREIGIAMNLVGTKVYANAEGDYSVDDSKRFPAFVEATVAPLPEAPVAGRKTISAVVDAWTRHSAGKKAPATIRRYMPSLASFARFQKNKDVRLVTNDDVRLWAEHRHDKDGIAPMTVNRNDLVAVKALFTFTISHAGGKLRVDNPARGIKLDKPKTTESLDKKFSEREISEILGLARSVKPRSGYPRSSASRRWTPWLCAYSGARIQEVCSLEKGDIRLRDGIYAMHFSKTKEGIRRWVVFHDALIDEGFLEFLAGAPDGPLFAGDKPQKENASRCAAEQRASELATWIRKNVALEEGVSPQHAWRHTFITRAREAKFDPAEMVDVVVGHNRKKNAAAGYYSPTPKAMKAELAKFPRYDVEEAKPSA